MLFTIFMQRLCSFEFLTQKFNRNILGDLNPWVLSEKRYHCAMLPISSERLSEVRLVYARQIVSLNTLIKFYLWVNCSSAVVIQEFSSFIEITQKIAILIEFYLTIITTASMTDRNPEKDRMEPGNGS